MDSAINEGGETSPALKAIKLMLPMVIKHIRKADDATITKFSLMLAEGMHWVATGEEKTSHDGSPIPLDSASGNQSEEDTAGFDNRGIRVREIDAGGISDSTVHSGESESPDIGSGYEAEISGGIPAKRVVRVKAVQAVGPWSETSEFDALTVTGGSEQESD